MPRGRRAAIIDTSVPSIEHVPFRKPFNSKLHAAARKIKNLKATLQVERQYEWPKDAVLYDHIRAPVPLVPIKKYCDLTGLE
eukprot:gene4745-6831_t